MPLAAIRVRATGMPAAKSLAHADIPSGNRPYDRAARAKTTHLSRNRTSRKTVVGELALADGVHSETGATRVACREERESAVGAIQSAGGFFVR